MYIKKILTTLTAICIAIFTMQAATIQVSPGTNTIYDAINAASPGDILIIADGTYNESITTIISKALIIKAAEGASPFVNHKRYDINVGAGDNVTIQGLIFDNTAQSGTEPVRVNSGTNNSLKFINCTFQNSTTYGITLYNVAVQADTLLVSGCIFKNLQNSAIYTVTGGSAPGRFKNAIIENSTFVNIVHPSSLTYAIYLNDHDATVGSDPKVLVDHCTFYNTAPGSYVMYFYKIGGSIVRNCIVSNDATKKSNYAYYVYNSSVSNSIWYNCNSGFRSGAVVTNVSNVDPMFINPALNDFNMDPKSPAVGAATDSKNIGDTRWKVAAAELSISIAAPATDQQTSNTYRIGFVPLDPSGNATISLFYSTDNENWTSIVQNLASTAMYYDWNVRNFVAGSYYVKAVITDGSNSVNAVSVGRVVVVPDVIAPRVPADLTGNFADGKVTLNWKNPTTVKPVLTSVNDFESGIGAFSETKSVSGAEGSFQSVTGQTGNGLQVNFDIQTAWSQYGVKTSFTTPVDYVSTIEFWYKGNGSANKIRVIIEAENGDWWYNESLVLSSTEWQKATLNPGLFSAFSWHTNLKTAFDNMKVTALNFVVTSGTVITGNFALDGISFSGSIPPSTDFAGTKIVRRTDRYPVDHTDGIVVYNGDAETFVDQDITSNQYYYYAAFSYDDLNNYSAFSTNAAYMHNGTSTSISEIAHAGVLLKVYPTVIESTANVMITLQQSQNIKIDVYNVAGIKVAEIVNGEMSEGTHSLPLNTGLLNNGLYFVKMWVGNKVDIEKILINK